MTVGHPFTGQVVDTETAWEFAGETLQRTTQDDLGEIAGLAERKGRAFRAALAPLGDRDLTHEEAHAILRSVFSTRRRADAMLDAWRADGFSAHVRELLHAPAAPEDRLAAFHEQVAGVGRGVPPGTGFDLGSELLHFGAGHPLWTRWIWDPEPGTGALPLVLTEDVDLYGDGVADTYRRVGLAIAFLNETGEAAGFRPPGGVYGTDVFLGCVYAVYMYTTLRMRMTQEFNQVVPDLGELLRRLLGVHRSPLLAEEAA